MNTAQRPQLMEFVYVERRPPKGHEVQTQIFISEVYCYYSQPLTTQSIESNLSD